jgi:O-Antigen ligase
MTVAHLRIAVVAASVPAVACLMFAPGWTTALTASSLPILHDVSQGGGVNIGISDVLGSIAFVGLAIQVLMDDTYRQRLAWARPAFVCAAPFAAWLVVLVAVHFSARVLVNTFQDLQLTIFPLALGVAALNKRTARWAMWGFTLFGVVLALTWIAGGHTSISGDKNAAGQFIADAILVTLAMVRPWWIRIAMLAVLVGGLLGTESRGAVVAVCVGLVILGLAGGLGNWQESMFGLLTLAVMVVGIFTISPQSVQQRVNSITTSDRLVTTSNLASGSIAGLADLPSEEYSVRLRSIFRHDGIVLAEHNALVGVGVGNYLTGSPSNGTQTNDPHDFLIRTAAEGGVPDLAFFAMFVLASGLLVSRRFRRNPWVVPAIAVQAAILVHGSVDVYWVRGTPVLGWLLVGMAFNRDLDAVRDHVPLS